MTTDRDPSTLLEAFDRMVEARRDRAAIRVHDGEGWVERSWGSIADEAERVALGLSERGVRAGDRVSIMAPSSLPWIIVEVAVFRPDLPDVQRRRRRARARGLGREGALRRERRDAPAARAGA
jgi:long-subunit acyl-CoA synthetase (AMP-forming)